VIEDPDPSNNTLLGTLTVVDPVRSIMLNPPAVDLLPGDSDLVEVRLSEPAGPGELEVSLTSSDSSIVSVDSPAPIAEGETGLAVEVSAGYSSGEAIISASAEGWRSGSTAVRVVGADLTIWLPDPVVLFLGHEGVVSLPEPAGPGGVIVSLELTEGFGEIMDPSIHIPDGGTQGTFLFYIYSETPFAIEATADGYSTAIAVGTATSFTPP
jgi:hypothetical protein